MLSNLVDEFNNKMDNITSWRIQELSNIKLELNSINSDFNKSFLLRGSIALIYAHWEGAIRDIFLLFTDLINKLINENIILLSNHSVFILKLILHQYRDQKDMKNIICDIYSLNKLLQTNLINLDSYKKTISDNVNMYKVLKPEIIEKLNTIESFLNNQSFNIKIINNVVNTESNLGFEVLENIITKFDIKVIDTIKVQKFRINQLLNDRNAIAHGKNKFYYTTNKINREITKTIDTLDAVIELIEVIKKNIIDKSELIYE
jgi:hypothetical protein